MNLLRLSILTLSAAALAVAQDHITVPLSNPSQPATLKVHLITGSITITAGAAGQVVIDAAGGRDRDRGRRDRDNPPPGMHRIDPSTPGLEAQEDHNMVTVGGGIGGAANLTIQVPSNTSVDLHTISGPIDITGLSGDIDAEATNSSVQIKNVSGAVVAHTLNGSINVSIDRIASNKPMSFSSLNGAIDVALPADTKARLRLKTNHGEIFTDFDVKLEPDASNPVVENNRDSNGKYKIRVDRGIYGSINGGGPEYAFQTLNGTITIHKK